MRLTVAIDKYPGSPDRLMQFTNGDLYRVIGNPAVTADKLWIEVTPHSGSYVAKYQNLAWGYHSVTLCVLKDLGMIEYPGYGELQTYEVETPQGISI